MPLIYAPLLFFYSFFADQWLKELQIWFFFAIFMVIVFVLAIFLTAMDSWIPILFEEKDKIIGSYARWIGMAFGGFIGYNVFILLNSDKWCKKVFGLDSALLNKS